MNAEPVLQHLDAACLVADKPAGLLAVPGRGEKRLPAEWGISKIFPFMLQQSNTSFGSQIFV